jgi:16S rRNA (cytosine1402-N4)-methyltransferase
MLRWSGEMPIPTGFFSMNSITVHVPVLLEPVLQGLFPSLDSAPVESNRAPRVLVDGTLGGGGHAVRMAERLSDKDTLIGIDRDPAAIARFRSIAANQLGYRESRAGEDWVLEASDAPRWLLCQGTYCELPDILERAGIAKVEGILLDLGLSSDQLQDSERGFSFRGSGPLDLRFDPSSGISAADLLQQSSEEDIANMIYRYGEERFSRRIARAIVELRRTQRIETAQQLADLVHRAVPGRTHGRIDSATRTFQGLRIAVNRELEHVENALLHLPECLSLGGRLAVISFHSLEDRIVKHAMRNDPRLKVLTKKPIIANSAEVATNPRSRSAKLRIAERVAVE